MEEQVKVIPSQKKLNYTLPNIENNSQKKNILENAQLLQKIAYCNFTYKLKSY